MSTENLSPSFVLKGTASTAIHTGGVLIYKLKVSCNLFLRSSGVLGFLIFFRATIGPYPPSTAGTFWKKFRKNSERPRKRSQSISLNSLERRAFPELSPPQYGDGLGRLFFQNWFRRGPLRAAHGIPSSTECISELSS